MKRTGGVVKYVIGIDEVGRGPLAGPVTLCAFAVPKQYLKTIENVGAKDSKMISEQKREILAKKLRELSQESKCAFCIASSSSHVIDRKGINKAIYIAIKSVLRKLELQLAINPHHMDIYLDGGLHAGKRYFRQHTIIRGDQSIPVISCASILAKVHRDRLLNNYDLKFPEYGFLDHKGYGTPEHYRAIRKNGPTTLHRMSFLKSLHISAK